VPKKSRDDYNGKVKKQNPKDEIGTKKPRFYSG